MKKEIIEINIEEYLSWTYGVKISKIREDLDRLEKLGATDINIEYGEMWDTSYCDITAVEQRLETDEECQERTNKLNKYKKQDEARELEEYENN